MESFLAVIKAKVRANLGRKGAETRARLLQTTRQLLKTTSPFDLTVAAIAKAANTAPGTLYVYFRDVPDLFYELSIEATNDFARTPEEHFDWFGDPSRRLEDTYAFVTEFCMVWERHSHVLHYRNLEADRGNLRYQALRTASALPAIKQLSRALRVGNPEMTKNDAQADAVVLYGAVERVAASPSNFPSDRPGPSYENMIKALVRIISGHLGK